ncbi:MAG: response regulator [Alphaproteobacteria bacterium]|nr:response regulator [Alphaproteobacteria bacterium]
MRVLLVEDDNLIGDGIKTGLEKNGFTVDWFDNGADGEEALYTAPYAAVILDLGLPEVDGLTILKHWRSNKMKVPVLILTALNDVDSKILGLNIGADDYLGKPFSLKEIIARINALIRRNSGYVSSEIKYRNIVFNCDTKQVFLDNKPIVLAPKEVALVELLLLNKNRVLSKNVIEEKLYSWDDEVSSNAVEVHIHHIRKKLGKDIVRTVNKIGYVMED